ncbi:MAG: hypothetical protein GC162_08570 [Planctomycetes bacterium]|nr:hypothetical protein [Planctomycetota bacterium]
MLHEPRLLSQKDRTDCNASARGDITKLANGCEEAMRGVIQLKSQNLKRWIAEKTHDMHHRFRFKRFPRRIEKFAG